MSTTTNKPQVTPQATPKATRQAFGEALLELGSKHPDIVVLDADLSCSTKSSLFAKEFPHRFFQMGIAEANMIGTGAGLALAGKIPFICSFACFLTGRFDQIRMSISYTCANVRIVGTHAGVGIGEDGHSQMGLEDMACMRSLPNMTVLQPADEAETKAMVEELITYDGPAYLRLLRQNVPPVHAPNTKFKIGAMHVLEKGSAALVLATGGVVHTALEAAKSLQLPLEVVNVSSIKPIDREFLQKATERFSTFITVEDHYIEGGLGGAVAEVLGDLGTPTRLHRIGVEKFGESGSPSDLYEEHGLSAAGLESRFSKLLL